MATNKSLISIINQLQAEINVPQATVVVSSQDQNVLKLLALVRATCDELVSERDWQFLQSRYSFTTVDGVDNYAFPTGIKRFLSGTFFDETNRWPWDGPLTPGQWEWLKSGYSIVTPYSKFRVWQDRIYLIPTPGSSVHTFVCEYVSSDYVLDANTGDPKSDFTQDGDLCRFDHRTVIYGTKLKWLQANGQDTTAALIDFNRSLEFAKSDDAPAPTLSLTGCSGYRLLSNDNFPVGSWVV